MRQRVGFARALVLQPDLLLMDEPFSALDVLTAENLRNELMSLWTGQEFPTKAICVVTHNIEEAIVLADRVVVLSSNPGHVLAEFPIHLERPRDRRSPSFEALVDKLYGLLTGTGSATTLVEPGATPTSHPCPERPSAGWPGWSKSSMAKVGTSASPTSPPTWVSRPQTCCHSWTPPRCSTSCASAEPTSSSPHRQGFHHR